MYKRIVPPNHYKLYFKVNQIALADKAEFFHIKKKNPEDNIWMKKNIEIKISILQHWME